MTEAAPVTETSGHEQAAAGSAVPTQEEEETAAEGGANWMLAFVCAWAGGTSLNEAWVLLSPGGFNPSLLHNLDFAGYSLVGVGLFAFALEALQWGKRQRGIGPLVAVLLPTLFTLCGILALLMSHTPGRRI